MTMIIVVEPHALLRLGILQLLTDVVPDLQLEGADYSQLNEPAQQKSCDLLLLSLPAGDNPHGVIQKAQRAYSTKSIILLAEQSAMPTSMQGLPAIVCGYVPKHAAPEVLQASIRLVLAGGTCFPMHGQPQEDPPSDLTRYESVRWPPPTTSISVPMPAPSASRTSQQRACAESEMLGLTPRQYEVLVLLARGYPMKTVGRYLNISVATAKAHTETLYQRLDVHNRNAAVYAAVSRGAKLGWTSIGGSPDLQLEN